MNIPIDFDWKIYIKLNKDLIHMNENQAKWHYDFHGRKENRKYKILNDDFNWKNYLKLNSDLGDLTEDQAKSHYETYGFKENRKYSTSIAKSNSLLIHENTQNYSSKSQTLKEYVRKTYVYFISFTDYASSRLRGSYICNYFKDNSKYIFQYIYLSNKEIINRLKYIKNAIIVIIKGNDMNLYLKYFNPKNVFIHDILDIYHDPININLINSENLFNYVIVNSNHMKNVLIEKGVDAKKMIVIYHGHDPTINPTNIIKNEVLYIGTPSKCSIDLKKYGIILQNFESKIDKSIHFTYNLDLIDYHTSTKLATAIASNSLFISNRIPVFVELLGDDYPLFINSLSELPSKKKLALQILNDQSGYQSFIDKYYSRSKILLFENNVFDYIKLFDSIEINTYDQYAFFTAYFTNIANDHESFVPNDDEYIDSYDYYIFTNSLRNSIDFLPWKKISVGDIQMENRLLSRFIKWSPHLFLPMYNKCIYLDSYFMSIKKNIHLYNQTLDKLTDEYPIINEKHPKRLSLRDEINILTTNWSNMKESDQNMNKLKDFINLHIDGQMILNHPSLCQNGVLYFYNDTNNKNYKSFLNTLFQLCMTLTYRDQCVLQIVRHTIPDFNLLSLTNIQTAFNKHAYITTYRYN